MGVQNPGPLQGGSGGQSPGQVGQVVAGSWGGAGSSQYSSFSPHSAGGGHSGGGGQESCPKAAALKRTVNRRDFIVVGCLGIYSHWRPIRDGFLKGALDFIRHTYGIGHRLENASITKT